MIALITGANSGIGFVTTQTLAELGFDLILLVRNQEKADLTKTKILAQNPTIKIHTYFADLSDLKAVKTVAETIKTNHPVVDRLINNAGYSPDNLEFTAAGHEVSFVANHLSHFVLTTTLLSNLAASADARVINVSSMAGQGGQFNRMFMLNNSRLGLLGAYCDGKLANAFFARCLAKRYPQILSFSLHPGVVSTNFGANFTGGFKFGFSFLKPFMITPEKGAQTMIYLATAAVASLKNFNGKYFKKSKPTALVHSDLTDANFDSFWIKSEAAVALEMAR